MAGDIGRLAPRRFERHQQRRPGLGPRPIEFALASVGGGGADDLFDQLCRVGGIMAGQTLAAGADTAMVLALAAAMGGVLKPCTTVDLNINYMRPITKADAVLEAKVKRLGRSLAFCSVDIVEAGSGKPAAFATGTFAIL